MGESYGESQKKMSRGTKTITNQMELFFADYLFKFLIIGSAGSGKSCLLHQFIENKCK